MQPSRPYAGHNRFDIHGHRLLPRFGGASHSELVKTSDSINVANKISVRLLIEHPHWPHLPRRYARLIGKTERYGSHQVAQITTH